MELVKMFAVVLNRRRGIRLLAVLAIAACVLTVPSATFGKKKPEKAEPEKKPDVPLILKLDLSKIVWPPPPAVTRLRYLNWYSNEKYHPPENKAKKKAGWMDRMAGGVAGETKAGEGEKTPFALWTPYGMAVDKSGNLYVADGRVGAVFIFNTDTKEAEMIKNGPSSRFGYITGLAMDDD